MDKEFKLKFKKELSRYYMSIKAFLLGYDSWYIGQYLQSKRIVQWTSSPPSLLNKQQHTM